MTGHPVASVRSLLAVGACAASVAAVTVIPSPAAVTSAMTVSPAVALRAAVTPLLEPVNIAAITEYTPSLCCSNPPEALAVTTNPISTAIINAYDFAEPWVAYGFELADYALSFVPGLWWIAPAIDLAYFSIEPLVQAGVYSFAYLIDGQVADIGPTLALGVQEAVDNFIFFGIAWIGSLIPLPPLPPFPPVPPFPTASVSAPAQAVGRTAAVAGAAATATAPAEIVEAEIVAPVAAVATSVKAPRAANGDSVRAAAPAESAEAPASSAAQVGAESTEPTAAVETSADRSAEPKATGKAAAKSAARSGR